MPSRAIEVRPYRSEDEEPWVRCRVLSFLRTSYFDDVQVEKPRYDGLPAIELVAVDGDDIVGVLEVVMHGEGLATIETIAVVPDAARQGIGSALLSEAIASLPHDVAVLDAWTREDHEANSWYRRNGFTQTYSYLHVFADFDELPVTVGGVRAGFTPVSGWFHVEVEDEARVISDFKRVHQCRRYERPLC